jgi:hypothetical protein
MPGTCARRCAWKASTSPLDHVEHLRCTTWIQVMQLTLLLHAFALSRTSGHSHAQCTRQASRQPSFPTPLLSSHSAHTQRNLFCYPCGLDWAGTLDTQLSHCSWIYACRARRPLENCYFLFPAIRRAANGIIQQAVDEHYGKFVATPPSSGDPTFQ